ncbi:hypothetical protein HanRHA438_Chr15g0717681 [Helianthus annuus]|nr:hypothetical protein HanRHA438_Chr15g0717681 [Helianthus annuus]
MKRHLMAGWLTWVRRKVLGVPLDDKSIFCIYRFMKPPNCLLVISKVIHKFG